MSRLWITDDLLARLCLDEAAGSRIQFTGPLGIVQTTRECTGLSDQAVGDDGCLSRLRALGEQPDK
jgi:hypothetical protein